MTKELKKKIATINKDEPQTALFDECFKRIYALNISLKQAYIGVLSDVQTEYPNYKPYKSYESFKQSYYNRTK